MTDVKDIRLNSRPYGVSGTHQLAELGHSEPHGLVRAVQEAVREIDATMLKPVAEPGSRFVFQPRALLGLLAFWYTRQVYDSVTILAKLRQDLARSNFLCERVPDVDTIRRFRSENRGPLHYCLTNILRCLAKERMLQGLVTHVSETQLAEEANRRIIMAMFTDSLELDKKSANPGAE